MNLKKVLIIVVLFVSCSTKSKNNLIGEYASQNPLFNTGNYTIGNTLQLKKDSSFNYEGCGQIVRGKWALVKDSLVLFCFDFNYKDKELNQSTAHQCSDSIPFESFKIQDDGDLESCFKNKNRVIKNHLIKIND